MEVIRDEGFDIAALCGGCCSCATCHVYIDQNCIAMVPPISEDENLLLHGACYRKAGQCRLSCQIRVTEGMGGLKVAVTPAD